MFGLPDQAVGAIVAAIIGGFVAFLSLVISKEQTVSNFRQQWIDALRQDIASLVSHITGIHGESIVERTEPKDDLWRRVKGDFTRFNEVIVRIRLRLNPDESRKKEKPATVAVLDALKDVESIFSSLEPQFHKLEGLVATLVTNSQVILKENWKRVRSGEPIYRFSKWTALVVAVLLVGALILHHFRMI